MFSSRHQTIGGPREIEESGFLFARQSLAHMHGDAAHKGLLTIDNIAEAAIKGDVHGEELVRVEAKLGQAERGGYSLSIF